MLEKRVSDLEQYSRLINIEVKRIALVKGRITDPFSNIWAMSECLESESDIETVHCVSPKSPHQHFIAVSFSRHKENQFVKRARKPRFRMSHLGFSDTEDSAISND